MSYLGRVLTILEVSQKQNYIFSSKRLRANAERSDEIAYVTGSEFFRESAQDYMTSGRIWFMRAAGIRCFSLIAENRRLPLPKK